MAYSKVRGFKIMSTISSLDSVNIQPLYEFVMDEYVTIRRIMLTICFSMDNTAGFWPNMPSVPAVIGLGSTTNGSGAPPAPANGPITAPEDYQWMWDGIVWRPNYIPASGTAVFDWTETVDLRANHAVAGAVNETVWAGIEVNDNNSGTPWFSNWQAIIYYNILFSPTVT